MKLAPRTKKIAALIAAGLVVILIAFVAVLALLVGKAEDAEPVVTAYADGRAVDVTPYLYCAVNDPLCDNVGQTTELDVGPSPVVQLSLPDAVAGAPWVLALVYRGDDGAIVENSEFNLPDSRLAATVPTKDDENRSLIGIEIRLPTGIIDVDTNQEEIVSHAVWSIATPA